MLYGVIAITVLSATCYNTCAVDGVEAFALDGRIWAEGHVEAIGTCDHLVRYWSRRPAVTTNQRRRSVIAVKYLHSVVGTFQMSFQLKVAKRLQTSA